MNKFGFVLTSREAGKEAQAAFRPTLAEMLAGEGIVVDFLGVHTLSPAWGDEFLTPLKEKYGDRVRLKKSANPSVIATIALLEKIHGFKFGTASN